jgi:excisionase family DNA binding protein
MQEIINKEFLTIGEAIGYMGVSRSYIYGLIHNKEVSLYKVNKRSYIKRLDLVDYSRYKMVLNAIEGGLKN